MLHVKQTTKKKKRRRKKEKERKKKCQNNPKLEICQSFISLRRVVEITRELTVWIWGNELSVYLQRRWRLKLLFPYVPMLMKTKKSSKKKRKQKWDFESKK